MQRAAGSLQSSWRNDGCGSRFGGRLFRSLSIMKSETLQEFKQFLAEEWGIGVEEISAGVIGVLAGWKLIPH